MEKQEKAKAELMSALQELSGVPPVTKGDQIKLVVPRLDMSASDFKGLISLTEKAGLKNMHFGRSGAKFRMIIY